MLLIECEDKEQKLFRLWCTELKVYVLEGVGSDGIRDHLRKVVQRNADTWTIDMVTDALERGEVPRKGGPVH